MASLDRFVTAQGDTYPRTLVELHAGRKLTHWMWFVFPQIAGLGRSAESRFYAISNLAEAKAYLAHPLLGLRLAEATEAVMSWAARRDAVAIFGTTDAAKFRSSLTLFETAGASCCGPALDAFYEGKRDELTLGLLDRAAD